MDQPQDIKKFPALNQRGMNLIEVLVALVILSVGLLGTASLLVGVIRANQTSKNISSATTLAKDKIEALSALPYSSLPDADTIQTEAYNTITNYATFQRIIKTEVDTPAQNMKKVTVQVYWPNGSNPITMYKIFVRQ